ncbi:hypothetical protein GBA52_015496 [Prunus armeniaca]|nr:hypothetical protein GBA52_015496 [Prunus armeniaca]
MHEVEKEHKRVIAKQLVDQERKNGTGRLTARKRGDLSITLLDPRHVFIKLSNKEDMHQKREVFD